MNLSSPYTLNPKPYTLLLACALALLFQSTARSAASPPSVLQELKSFDQFGSVLLIAAHPDDEDTQLLTSLAHGRNYRAAYLSVTRGDGGQNELGDQFGPELGVIRTHELLAARELDGARQYFTRAIDFGFSKDYRQTLQVWDKDEVTADIIRVVREFRPDVMVTRFSTLPGNTHGHHTASAVLGLEAFKLAGDANAFPDQLKGLPPWQPTRIFTTGFGVGMARGGNASTQPDDLVAVDVSGTDPVSGLSFAELSAKSRSMHKTQGFGNFTGGGRGGGGGGPRSERLLLIGGQPAAKDMMDGIDTTWNRVTGGADVAKLTDALLASFNSDDLSANVTQLLAIKKIVDPLPADPIVDEKKLLLDKIITECLGLEVQTKIDNPEVVAGETMQLQQSVTESANVPVKWVGVRYPSIGGQLQMDATNLTANQLAERTSSQTLPTTTPISQPYWLREPGTRGMFRVDDASLIGRPLNPPVFPVEFVFNVAGQDVVVPDEPMSYPSAATQLGEAAPRPRALEVIPSVYLKFSTDVLLFAPGETKKVSIEVTPNRPNCQCSLSLNVPDGWKVSPARQDFTLSTVTDKANQEFNVTAPSQPSTAMISADVAVAGVHSDQERIEINYSHIPFILLQPAAQLKAVAMDLQIRGKNVGYIAGAGDSVDAALRQMGYNVTALPAGQITPENLKGLDGIVTGVRAFAVRKDLAAAMPALNDFVQAGGNMIVQYNRAELGVQSITLGNYALHLTNSNNDRVTDPNSPVTFLAPDHPALNTPNKINSADFADWIQERGTYFPTQWDDHFVPILAVNDAGEAPLKGSLLIAPYGQGHFVYSGLVFFRELPAGVPGAYRLMANLVSLGK